MYTKLTKGMLDLCILDILKRYTDESHRLSQKDIAEILRNEYATIVERKAIKRNLMNLIEAGFDLEYSESVRMMPEKDGATGEVKMVESAVLSDFYLRHDFTDAELRLLIDSLLFSTHIPYSQCMELIGKLEGLSSVYFKSKVRHIATFPTRTNDNKQLFYTIDLLDEAIGKRRQVSFAYCEYRTDKKLHRKRRPDGSVREYVINPYQMAAKEGKYYLICNLDKYNDISNYRIDRITDVKILDTPIKPFESLDGAKNDLLDLSKYMTEHLYMFSSESVWVDFRIPRAMIGDVIDLFGSDVRFSDETDTQVSVRAYVNEMAMRQFAKAYAPDVVVLGPQGLVEQVREDTRKTWEMYNQNKGETL